MVKFKNAFLALYLLYSLSSHTVFSDTCIFSHGDTKYDFSRLNWGTWNFTYIKNTTLHLYLLSLCDPINLTSQLSSCNGAVLCESVSNQTQKLIESNSYNYTINEPSYNINGFSVILTQDKCLQKENTKFQLHIFFTCSDSLGSPELTLIGDCFIYVEWKTLAACKNVTQNQVPCYVIESNGDKRDLSPLIKVPEPFYVENLKETISGEYEVQKIIFSVCSELKSDKESLNCPKGSSVCLLDPKNLNSQALGYLKSPLKISNKDLLLTYEGRYIADCNKNFSTSIYFVCPDGKLKIQSDPKIIFSSKCDLYIEYETIYSCPHHTLTASPKDCKLTSEIHGLDIDLNPLKGTVHHFNFSNKTFDISVCSNLGEVPELCGPIKNKKTSICMTENKDLAPIGLFSESYLRYNGESVELISNTFQPCKNNPSMYVNSVIRFECDESAPGTGEVSYYEDSSDCSHVFTWKTFYACPLNQNCRLTDQDKSVDLTYLRKPDGWQVVIPDSPSNDMRLSVCGLLSNSSCSRPSTLCSKGSSNKTINYGLFRESPKYDSKRGIVTLKYEKGDFCNGTGIVEADIICRKESWNSSPHIVYKTECFIKIIWYTAIICSEELVMGERCLVKDVSQDVYINLADLPQPHEYPIQSTNNSKILFSLCNALSSSPCSGSNVAVCKVTTVGENQTISQNYGSFSNSSLSFKAGLLKLDYLDGDEVKGDRLGARYKTSIVFLCDPSKRNGEPQFVEEIENEIRIIWFTNLVCSRKPSPNSCLVTNTKHNTQYDLSNLGTRSVTISTGVNKTRFYINVCDALQENPLCFSNASACSVNILDEVEHENQPNLGVLSELPKVLNEGRLEAVFTNGSECNTRGSVKPFITYVYLQCSHDPSENDLQLLEPQNKCRSTFLWTTPEACPVQTGQDEKHVCLIEDGDYHLDLRSLANIGSYTLKTAGDEVFTFNICGPLKDSPCKDQRLSVCEHGGSSPRGFALASTMVLSYDPSDLYNPSIIYTSRGIANASNYIFEVQLVCPSENLVDGQAKIKSRTDNKVEVNVASNIGCRSKTSFCHFTDSRGEYYDLRPLVKQKSNYEYYYNDSLISLNFCNQVERSSELCPPGYNEACMTKGKEKTSLGHTQHFPKVTAAGEVLIHFVGGSKCAKEKRFEMELLLKCSTYEGHLNLLGIEECTYIFSLETKYACSKKAIEGESDLCQVKSPFSEHIFDLIHLKYSPGYVEFKNTSDSKLKYIFNVCGPLDGARLQKGCQGASACVVSENNAEGTNLGLYSAKLRHLGDKIQLNYENGSPCENGQNRSTQMSFFCDKGKLRDIAISTDISGCITYIDIPTKYACEPVEEMDCQIFYKGQMYDLSPLSQAGIQTNKPTLLFDGQWGNFIFDVCRAIDLSLDSPCRPDSAACLLIDSKQFDGTTKRGLNLGKVSSPKFVNDKLVLEYRDGDICRDNLTYSTYIEFVCSDNIVNHPDFLQIEDCVFYFEWATPAACPIKHEYEQLGNCRAKDDEIGFTYDLSSLGKQTHKVLSDKYLFQVSICSKGDSGTDCGGDAGICQIDTDTGRMWKLGDLNPDLILNGTDSLYLKYRSGDWCHNKRYQRSSVINFVCSHQKQEGLHFMYEEEDCTYHFVWYTELACKRALSCQLELHGELIDLNPLIDPVRGFHVAENDIDDGKTYLVNVCGPIKYGDTGDTFSCPIDAGICQVPSRLGESPKSLGKPHMGLISSFQENPVLLYVNGSPCHSKPGETYRSKIDFKCNQSIYQGNPVLINYDEDYCTFEFVWETTLACDSSHNIDTIDDSCILEYENHIFDLTGLTKPSTDPYKVTEGNDSYLINVCGFTSPTKTNNCGDAAICHLKDNTMSSLGSKINSSLYFDGARLILYYKNGEDCPTSISTKKTSEIIFDCNHKVAKGAPVLIRNNRCQTIFRWETSAACREQTPQCQVVVNGKEFDLRTITKISESYNATNDVDLFWLNVCYPVKQSECPPESIACMWDSHSSQIYSLGKYTTQEVDVDEKGNLVLRYYKGSYPCANDHEASVIMTLVCGGGLPSFKYKSFDKESCTFKFIMTSKFICQEQDVVDLEEKNALVYDPQLSMAINLTTIFNKSFTASGLTNGELYAYEINLNKGVGNITSNDCKGASICQIKSLTNFYRDIGSTASRRFVKHGQHISITFTSHGRACGKNNNKNVTTVFFLSCDPTRTNSSPTFVYESNNCDYLFEWDTKEICYSKMIRMTEDQWKELYTKEDSNLIPQASSNVGLILGIIIILVSFTTLVVFLYFRRGGNLSRFRECFRRLPVRTVSYKRVVNQAYMNNNDSQPICDFENEDPTSTSI